MYVLRFFVFFNSDKKATNTHKREGRESVRASNAVVVVSCSLFALSLSVSLFVFLFVEKKREKS